MELNKDGRQVRVQRCKRQDLDRAVLGTLETDRPLSGSRNAIASRVVKRLEKQGIVVSVSQVLGAIMRLDDKNKLNHQPLPSGMVTLAVPAR